MSDGAKVLRHTHAHKYLTSCLQLLCSGVPLGDFVSGVQLFVNNNMVWRWLGSGFQLLFALRCNLFGSFPLFDVVSGFQLLLAAFRF